MPTHKRLPKYCSGGRRRQHGAAAVEYTVVLVALLGALFADPSVLTTLADAVRTGYQKFIYALSASWF